MLLRISTIIGITITGLSFYGSIKIFDWKTNNARKIKDLFTIEE